jgi:hypothetical protein
MRKASILLAVLVLGCVENEEKVVVRPDGSLDVSMSAKGDSSDLVDGYVLPLSGAWRALDDTTLAWIERIGPDTGSPASKANLAARGWSVDGKDETRLSVAAHFASAAELPRLVAPEGELYRSAYLERETKLAIEHKGARTIYTFERTFGARRSRDLEVLSALEDKLPEPAREAISKKEPIPDKQWPAVTRIVLALYRHSSQAFAREALGAVYTLGDASLPTSALASALSAVDADIGALVTEPLLRRIYAALREYDGELEPALNPDLLVRDVLRKALERSLSDANVPQATRYAVLERLEWSFTAFDQTVDLGDESFGFEVEMPGVVVLGNFDSLDGSTARWDFKGEDLHDAARVLRVVSVVE